jgi:hypothetical protein
LAVDATTTTKKKNICLEREQVMKTLGGTVWFFISLHRAEQQSVGGEKKKRWRKGSKAKSTISPAHANAMMLFSS